MRDCFFLSSFRYAIVVIPGLCFLLGTIGMRRDVESTNAFPCFVVMSSYDPRVSWQK